MLIRFSRWISTPGTYKEDYLFGKSLGCYRAMYFWRVDDWGNAYMKELPIFRKVRKYYE